MPHIESIIQNPPKHPLPLQLEHRYAHFQTDKATCGVDSDSDADADRNSLMDDEYGKMYYLFNLTADPYEMNNLDIVDYPEVISHIQGKLVELRKKRPLQQAFWMQLHQKNEFPKTFISGGRYNHFHADAEGFGGVSTTTSGSLSESKSSNGYSGSLSHLPHEHRLNTPPGGTKPSTNTVNAGTLFIHPWYSDDEDPWLDVNLIDGKVAADEKLNQLLIKLLGVHVVIFGILEYIVSTIIKLFK